MPPSSGSARSCEDYDDFTQLIAYGVQEEATTLVEVHFFYPSGTW